MTGNANARRRSTIVRPAETVDEMVRAIADDIVSGAARPGSRLDEQTLAARFGVSRTPVREALRQLTAMGLVERRPNRGASVAEVSRERLASMFEAMTELEAICARLSAQRMTSGERAELDAFHQSSAKLIRQGAEDAYEAHNTAFHTRLYLGAHNAHIHELAALTRSRLAPFRRAQFRLAGRLGKSWQEHDAIVEAILRGDAEGAERAARAHVEIVGDASSELVQQIAATPANA